MDAAHQQEEQDQKKKEALELLKKATEMLGSNQEFSHQTVNPRPPYIYPRNTQYHCNQPSKAGNPRSDVKSLFRPYSGRKRMKTESICISTWTHKFCCLWNVDTDAAPSKEEKRRLFEAGLGERRITFAHTNSESDFNRKLEEIYPKLVGCGGFELLRSASGGRSALEVIKQSSTGYSAEYLATSYLGQAMCFIRPIQKDLDCSPVEIDEETCCKETCFTCGKGIPIHSLRDHVQECRGNEEETNENIDEPRKIDRPICGFICV